MLAVAAGDKVPEPVREPGDAQKPATTESTAETSGTVITRATRARGRTCAGRAASVEREERQPNM